MKIHIEIIPHHRQRYETAGDWYFGSNGDIFIKVSDLGNFAETVAVAIHELVEVCLCKIDGITQSDVDQFDLAFEARRGGPDNTDEPGDDPLAPYRKQHFTATTIERIFAQAAGIDWKHYEDTINSL